MENSETNSESSKKIIKPKAVNKNTKKQRGNNKCPCGNTPGFGFKDKGKTSCGMCKVPGMLNLAGKKTCVVCGAFAYYAEPSNPELRIHCGKHKVAEFIIKDKHVCVVCKKVMATFTDPGDDIPKYCADHRPEEYEDIHKMCETCGMRRAGFGSIFEDIKRFCSICKRDGDVDLANPQCIYGDCKRRPTYGDPFEMKLYHCEEHKDKDEIDLYKLKCVVPKCYTVACFGDPIKREYRHCDYHKDIGEINLVTRRCKHPDGCNDFAYYGPPGTKTPLYCKQHKSLTDINVVSKRCEFGCGRHASYGNIIEKKRRWCFNHKQPGDIDLNNPKCLIPGCNIYAYYGRVFGKKEHCYSHRRNNEVTARHPKCHSTGCKSRPVYSRDDYPNSCEEHKLQGEVNIIEKPCKSCRMTYFIPYDRDLCAYCYVNPDKTGLKGEKRTTLKKKEARVKELLTRNDIGFESYNKIIEAGCSLYRPDFVINTPFYKIIVEVDEFQHRVYGETCEHNRMMQLMYDSGMEQILFIRYNPDNYYDNNYIRCPGDIKQRETHLINVIKKYMNPMEPLKDPGVNIIYLYYDGYNGIPDISKVLNFE